MVPEVKTEEVDIDEVHLENVNSKPSIADDVIENSSIIEVL